MRTKLLAIFLPVMLMGILNEVHGQQRITYTQYMFNGLVLNPAYAGTDKYTNITAQGRQQWMGAKGGPNSQTASAHGRLQNGRIGLGMVIEQENVGVTSTLNIYGMYAYKIRITKKNLLSLGLQVGATTYRERLTDLTLPQGTNDPNFANDVTYVQPNFGVGLYYYQHNKFYIGLSVPSIAQNTIDRNNPMLMTEVRQYMLTGGYLWSLNPRLKIKPNFLLKVVKGAPLNLDLNTSFLIDDKIWVGCSYRLKNSVNPVVELQATQKLRVGVSYDIPTSELTKTNFRSGSPEIMINYRFVKLMKNRVISPRYF
jgi:type IX secretion system PorP/SprF family membrane protein